MKLLTTLLTILLTTNLYAAEITLKIPDDKVPLLQSIKKEGETNEQLLYRLIKSGYIQAKLNKATTQAQAEAEAEIAQIQADKQQEIQDAITQAVTDMDF